MNRAAMLLASSLISAVAFIGCGPNETPSSVPVEPSPTEPSPGEPPEGERIQAELVEFVPDRYAARRGGALHDEPLDPLLAFGRDGSRDDADRRAAKRHAFAEERADEDLVYVASSGRSGCSTASGAELWRDGDTLRVEWTGLDEPTGDDEELNCARSFEPYAQFAVDPDTVADIDIIGEDAPLPPEGPADLLDVWVVGRELSGPALDDTGLGGGVRLGTSEAQRLLDGLHDLDTDDQAAPSTLTGYDPPPSHVGFLLTLQACGEHVEDPAIAITTTEIRAVSRIDRGMRECDEPAHSLVLFEVAKEDIPNGAEITKP